MKYPPLSPEAEDAYARMIEGFALSGWKWVNRSSTEGMRESMSESVLFYRGDAVDVFQDGSYVLADDCSAREGLDELADAYANMRERIESELLSQYMQTPTILHNRIPQIVDTYTDRLGIVWTIRADGSWTSGTGITEGDWKPTWHEPTHWTKHIADIKNAQERN